LLPYSTFKKASLFKLEILLDLLKEMEEHQSGDFFQDVLKIAISPLKSILN